MIDQKEIDLYWELHGDAKFMAQDKLFNFFVSAWPTMEARFPLDSNWHIGLACEYLEAVYYGQIEKLVINWPTRYLKSLTCTVAFPAWCWANDARSKFISWSFSGSLSSALSWKRRQLIESLWYKQYWGDKVIMADDQNLKTRYANKAGGMMLAGSTGAGLTGDGCDIMIIDDPQDPKEASSDTQRLGAIDFWTGTASSRFDNKKKKSCVLVMQRLHEKDLTGYFLAEYENAVHLKIPNQAQEQIIYSYPRTGRIKVYEKGEILQPSREDVKELAEAKKELGSWNYAAQRQQEPVPRGGGMIKEAWFKYYDELPERFDYVTLSIDCAFKDLKSSDYVVLQAWGQVGARHYLLKQMRSQIGFSKTRVAVELWGHSYFPNYYEFLIEDKANGPAIIDVLDGTVRALIPINPTDSKVARLAACEPEIEAGDIWLPNPDYNPWVRDIFIPEVISFPKAEYDDQVDCMTQYLNRARLNRVGEFPEDDDEDLPSGTFAGALG